MFLENNGTNVILRIGQSPDEDILYVSNFKHFIGTGGGYSLLLSKIVKDRGGNTPLVTKNWWGSNFVQA